MSEANVGGQGAGGEANAGAAAAAAGGNGAGAQAAPAAPADWTTGLSDDLKGFVQLKQFKDAGAVVESYRNLEKLHGVPADRIIKLPEKMDETTLNNIYDRLGRPKNAQDYDFKAPEGSDGKFAEWAKGLFHGTGLTKQQGEKLATAWNEYIANQTKASTESRKIQLQKDQDLLKKEWGAAFDQNMNVADQAAAKFGISEEQAKALSEVWGPAAAVRFLHSLGSKVGEDVFVRSDRTPGFSTVLTPAAAQNRISSLKNDPGFAKRLVSKDADAKAEWEQLHKWAYPTQAAG